MHELFVYGSDDKSEVKLIHSGGHAIVSYKFDKDRRAWVARVIPIVDDARAAIITIRATNDGGATLTREDWHYKNGTWTRERVKTTKVC